MGLVPDDLIARLCMRQAEILILFSASCLGLVLTVGSLLLFDLGETSRVVAVMNLPGLLLMIAWTGYVIYRCRDGMPFGRGEPKP